MGCQLFLYHIIIKFPKIRETEKGYQAKNVDTLFGGELSLERESYLYRLVAKVGLPAPKVLGIYNSSEGNYIVTACSPGISHREYMIAQGHTMKAFTESLASLGHILGRLYNTNFPSFGNIMDNSVIEPAEITCFSDRYKAINDRILNACHSKGGLTDSELVQVENFFNQKFEFYRERLDIKNTTPRLVITDLHADNFFVYPESGQPSGFFDVESAQAAPLEFELYGLRFFIFNSYDEIGYQAAEKAFWDAYCKTSGFVLDEETNALIDFFAACRLLEIFQSYWGITNNIRETWGAKIKKILFNYMQSGRVDYLALGDIWRERDGQPKHLA